MAKKFHIKPKDAEILEGIEQRELRRKRTEQAIGQTYKSEFQSDSERKDRGRKSEKPFTKSRRKLPGKRKWKNKVQQYFTLKTQMFVARFNDEQLREKTLKRIYKYNGQNNSIADAIVRGDDPV